jgi:hypothetical protein
MLKVSIFALVFFSFQLAFHKLIISQLYHVRTINVHRGGLKQVNQQNLNPMNKVVSNYLFEK